MGLYYYGARWYDPYITQFSQPDPIIQDPFNPVDWNRYTYARNNPINLNDPTGYDADCGMYDDSITDPQMHVTEGCHEYVKDQHRQQIMQAAYDACKNEGIGCPDYAGLAVTSLMVLGLPGPDELGVGLDVATSGLSVLNNYILKLGSHVLPM